MESKIEIEKKLEELKEKRKKNINNQNTLYFGSGILIIVSLFLIIAILTKNTNLKEIIGALLLIGDALILLLISILNSSTQFDIEINELQNDLDLKSIESDGLEVRAEKHLKNNQHQLKQYHDQTLKENKRISSTGLTCIFFAFAFIIAILFLFYNDKTIESNAKLFLGVIGGISTLLTSFVSAIVLKMHSKNRKSLAEFHNKLVNTQQLFIANSLASKIKDNAIRDKVFYDLALKIVEFKN